MKKYLLLVLALFSCTAHAVFISQPSISSNIYYVSPAANGGSDANNCSASKPCLTLAGTATKVTTAGSIIHMNTKLGSFAETVTTNLAVGVTLECDGSQYNAITSNIAGANTIQLVSTVEGTNGNQEIRNCKFDGGLVGLQGIYVQGRSNVKVHDNIATNWLNNFVTINGRSDNTYNFAPKVFAVGNEVYGNTITNSDRYSGSGSGAIQYGGQDGIKIYKNTVTSSRGTSAQTGWPIKYTRGGYSKNDKIFNNILTKPDMDGTGGFGFVGELWHGLGGTEIFGNTITGGTFDMNCYDKGTSAYSIDFHDNIISTASIATVVASALSLESSTDDVLFRNNFVYNLAAGGGAVYVYSHTTQPHFNNIQIINNIVVDSRLNFFSASGTGSTATFNNWLIANNTIYRKTVGTQAIMLPRYGKATNVQVRNNIVSGFTTSAVEYDGGATSTLDNLSIENNLFYNNGASNLLKTSGSTNPPTNVTVQNQINTDPSFVDVANAVASTAITASKYYRIAAVGTTNFMAIGASANTVGVWFKATGAGTGTGTADALDLRIPVGSPAVNKGTQIGIGYDYRGIRRTSLPDIGALEYDENNDASNVAQP